MPNGVPKKVCTGCGKEKTVGNFKYILNPRTGRGSVLSDYCETCQPLPEPVVDESLPANGELIARQPASSRRSKPIDAESNGTCNVELRSATSSSERFPEPIDTAGTGMDFTTFCDAWRSNTLDSVLEGRAIKSLATAMANQYLDRVSEESPNAH